MAASRYAPAMDADEAEWGSLTDRLADEAGAAGDTDAYERLAATGDPEDLADVLTAPGRPLWARELAAFRLGLGGDRRAFEALVLLLSHRDAERCVSRRTPSSGWGTRAPRGRPPPWPPTNCGSPTPWPRSACWRRCGPRRRCPR